MSASFADNKMLQEFDSYMDKVLRDWNAPAVGVGVAEGEKLIFAKGYGYRDYEKKLPFTPTTLDGGLFLVVPGQPDDNLVPCKGLRFRTPRYSDVVFEFLMENDQVKALKVMTPRGDRVH